MKFAGALHLHSEWGPALRAEARERQEDCKKRDWPSSASRDWHCSGGGATRPTCSIPMAGLRSPSGEQGASASRCC